jgi:phosphatidylserine/phosphatidylglycerophosphate/cardiolipin synthase-like enzyme
MDVLAKRSRAGVDVRVVLSESEEGQRTKRGLQLRSPSIQVRLLAEPRVHAKLAIADEERALLGSHNLTKDSLDSRREISLIVDDAQAVGAVLGVFRRDFEGVVEGSVAGAPGAALMAPGRPFMWGFMAGMVAPGAAALAWVLGIRRS